MKQWQTDGHGGRAVVKRHLLLWEVGYKDITMATSSYACHGIKISHPPHPLLSSALNITLPESRSLAFHIVFPYCFIHQAKLRFVLARCSCEHSDVGVALDQGRASVSLGCTLIVTSIVTKSVTRKVTRIVTIMIATFVILSRSCNDDASLHLSPSLALTMMTPLL
jgi:hypothetical protein